MIGILIMVCKSHSYKLNSKITINGLVTRN
jgi:hypothetical protein